VTFLLLLFPDPQAKVLSGEVSCKKRSDAAGHFVGKRVGSARAVAHEERSDDAATATRAANHHGHKKERAARRRPVI
jgi:hypothetical protein